MKNVLVRTGDRSYAIDSRIVLEIVPLVELQTPKQDNPYLTGTMLYRGQSIPVIDLCALLSARAHQKKFSTRIVVVRLKTQTVGLIAEGITDLVPENSSSEILDLQTLLASCI